MERILIIKIKSVGTSSLILRNLLVDILDKHDLSVSAVYDAIDEVTQQFCHYIRVELDSDVDFDFIDFKIIEK